VWRTLWSRITSGYYPAGSLIGTETALANEFNVSRVTLREALALLENEGLVDRRRSQGTFVSPGVEPRGVVEFTGYLEDIILQADSSQTVRFNRSLIAAPNAVAEALGLRDSEKILRIERLRATEGTPRLWLVDYLPRDIGKHFTDDMLRNHSVLRLLDQDPETHITSGHQVIRAEIGSPEVCERLELQPGEAVLHCSRSIFHQSGRPLSYVEMYYPGSRFVFEFRLGRA
jgi:GntR family transcriptional regulator